MFPRRLLLLSLLALSACAPARVPWANPTVPKEQWGSDWSACKRQAEDAVLGYRGGDEQSSSPLDAYDRLQAKREIDGMVAQCMYQQGYLPAQREH